MKNLKTIILAGLLALSCGGSGGNTGANPSETVSTKKILASNVVFKTSSSTASLLVGSANAEEIDTTTKVYAENVILDNADTALYSTNVQDAFVETQPDLQTAIVGTWTVTMLDELDDSNMPVSKGAFIFSSDGTFSDDGNTIFSDNIQEDSAKLSNPTLKFYVNYNLSIIGRVEGVSVETNEPIKLVELNLLFVKAVANQMVFTGSGRSWLFTKVIE